MKTCVVALVIPISVFFIFSCTALGSDKIEESVSPKTEKKQKFSAKKKSARPTAKKKSGPNKKEKIYGLNNRANRLVSYASQNGYSTKYCFLVDMSVHSGRNRFFVYDLEKNSVAWSGLVAHGSCNETFIAHPRFSNSPNSGCSSLGKFKVGSFYRGKYGESYKLHGLDNTNSNAFRRAVVLHAYDCVDNEEIYPRVLCNSFGCPMVSPRFFDRLARVIEQSEQPILLWIYK